MIGGLFALALCIALPLGFGLAAHELLSVRRGRASALAVTAVLPAIIALGLPRGSIAGGLVIPWTALIGTLGVGAVRRLVSSIRSGRVRWEPAILGFAIAAGFLAVGAAWAALDRLGVQPFGFGTTIVLLTAVHFHVAGFVLTLVGVLATRERPRWWSIGAVSALVVGTPVTAIGFFGLAAFSWVGALLVALGGIGIGITTITVARVELDRLSAWLLRGAGATLLVTMPLAAAYATGTTFGIAFLDVPAMAAIHGGLNVLGFAIPATLGWSRLSR